MAPTKKKSVNKRFLSEVSPDKEVRNLNKNKQLMTGKRKFADKLGPRWSNGELQRFYKAFRNYGKDWNRIAAEVRNRSAEMVEALYDMNKAYLSLPETLNSAVGLIAMVSDHYNVLDRSDSEQESNDVLETPRKALKRKRGKIELNALKEEILPSPSVTSNGGCLSLLSRGKLDGGQPRAVGKRTPRFPVSFTRNNDVMENYVLLKKKGRKFEVDGNDDEVAHVAAMALTQASQRGDSPKVCQTAHRRTEHIGMSPVQCRNRMLASTLPKLHDASNNEDCLGSKGPSIDSHSKDRSSFMDMEGVGTVEVHRKGKKFYGNKVKVEEIGNNQSDDGGEACSGTEGQKVGALKGKDEIRISNAKVDQTYQRSQRRRSKKLFSVDEVSAISALQTLAHVSLMECESSIQLKEETTKPEVDDKSVVPEAISTSFDEHKTKLHGEKGNGHCSESVREGTSSRKSKLGKRTAISPKPVAEAKLKPQSINMLKRKRQPVASNGLNAEASIDSCTSKALEIETLDEQGNIRVVRSRRTGQISGPSKPIKSITTSEGFYGGEQKSAAIDVAIQTVQVPVASQCILQTTKQSRRKMNLKQAFSQKEGKSSESMLKNQAKKFPLSFIDKAPLQKEELSSCLSSSMFRRWCRFEWFYSAIDYPWFAKREFVEYLNHVGLGNIPRLTHVEWGVIRSSLGKPRRFSERFLLEEREKLKQYRESVRNHYTELHTGVRDGLPTDLARPLSVGQRVIAVHPETRELHDGSVLTVDHDRYRVQFDRPDIRVEFVKDIDCMPSNPADNMPEALRRERYLAFSKELQANEHSNIGGFTSSTHLENSLHPVNISVKQLQVTAVDATNSQQSTCSQPYTVSQIQPKEADIQVVSNMTRALDKKDSSLHSLQQNNAYPRNALPPWLPVNYISPGELPSFCDSAFIYREPESTVHQIVDGSRLKARTMVDAAVKAISTMEEGHDAFARIGEALDAVDKTKATSESSRIQAIRSPELAGGSVQHQNSIPSTSERQANGNASWSKSQDKSEKIEAAIPSDLIASCVSTLLMIQTCTERQYPPADVAQIIDSAVTSLHPSCAQNLPIYREIQKCMGRIKTQVLALIPTSI